MKLSEKINISDILVPAVAVALAVPNLMACSYGGMSLPESLAVLLMPSGFYLIVMSLWRNSYVTALALLPLMVLAAFQIVVIALYDKPCPIGVDMFLNAVTSNAGEIGELLSGLIGALAFVSVLYLTVTGLAVAAAVRRAVVAHRVQTVSRACGIVMMLIGAAGLVFTHNPDRFVKNDLFPASAVVNLYESVARYHRIKSYHDTSRDFSYDAMSWRRKDREVYLAVVGETSRADNWSLTGYGRETNPCLSQRRDSLFVYDRAFSESNTTHKAVPMLLTTLSADNFEDSIYTHRSIISAFRDAGFHTVFVSDQERNGSFIEFYEQEADSFIPLSSKDDRSVLPAVDSLLSADRHQKLLVVVHLYGSHYKYNDRYKRENAVFLPDDVDLADRETVVNAYDNTVVNTDYTLDRLIGLIDSTDATGGLIYCSDHGEDLFDDGQKRFLHASPFASYRQLHVPLLMYVNGRFRERYPEKVRNMKDREHDLISTSRCYAPSLLDMAGVTTRYLDTRNSLLGGKFAPQSSLMFLNDKNEAVSVFDAGLDSIDTRLFRQAMAKGR